MFQLLVLMLYFSGLWGPLLRSMYIKEYQGLKFQLILGKARKRPGSSVLYYQARETSFWAALKARDQTPKASPFSNLVKMAKFDGFLTKIAKFLTSLTIYLNKKIGSRPDKSVETFLRYS